MFWGLIFTVIGISLIVEDAFHFSIPIGRTILGLIVVYFGVKMIFGSSHFQFTKKIDDSNAVFGESEFSFPPSKVKGEIPEYVVVFGQGQLDLREVDLTKASQRVKSDTVFGNTVIRLAKGLPVRISTNSVFSSIELPDKNTSSLGKFSYESDQAKSAKDVLHLEINAVFSSVEVIEM